MRRLPVALPVRAGTNAVPHLRVAAPIKARSLLLALALTASLSAPAADTAASLLLAAGNTPDDSVRLAHLRTLATRADTLLDAPTRTELTALLPVVESWAEDRTRAAALIARHSGETHRYLHNFFYTPTLVFDPPHPAPPRADSPLYPLWAFYRARFLTWTLIEDSSVSAVPARKAAYVAEAEGHFALARRAFPANELLRIYTGENLPAPAADLAGDYTTPPTSFTSAPPNAASTPASSCSSPAPTRGRSPPPTTARSPTAPSLSPQSLAASLSRFHRVNPASSPSLS